MELRLKTFIMITSILVSMHSVANAFETFPVPAACNPQDMKVVLVNDTATAQKTWLQVRGNGDIDELEVNLEAHSKTKVAGTEFLKTTQSFSVKAANSDAIQAILQCKDQNEILISSHTSPTVTHLFPQHTQSLKISLLNLYLNSNNVTLKALSPDGKVVAIKKITLDNSYDTESFKWILPSPVARLDVRAEERISSVVFYENQGVETQSHSIALTPATLFPDYKKTYFLVSTREEHPDAAFVIALDDAQKIATAREQIKNPKLEKIVVARIGEGHGGFNRAFLSKDKSPYSWSVTDVDNFADFAQIDCDGSPDLVEERLERKLADGGRICFWRYRVVKELSPIEIATGLLLNH